jgi:hypothetical protein
MEYRSILESWNRPIPSLVVPKPNAIATMVRAISKATHSTATLYQIIIIIIIIIRYTNYWLCSAIIIYLLTNKYLRWYAFVLGIH